MDVQDGRLYNDTIEYEGLTPLGTYEWVRHKAVKEWPTTYSELLEIGVPAAIVDWLELLIARENKADKVSVIASFLYAFISPTVEHVLASAISDFQASFKDPDNFVVSHDLNEIKLDALVFADVIKSMEHAVDGSWPNCMFDMELV